MIIRVAIALTIIVLAACASSRYMLTGTARPPISPMDVKIYSQSPPAYQEIAVIDASSKSMFAPGGPEAMDKLVARLRARAARLGANGLILEGFSDDEDLSLGGGVGTDSYSRRSSISLGAGAFLGVFKKTGKGLAIYVAPE
jgi:hypothetical protein